MNYSTTAINTTAVDTVNSVIFACMKFSKIVRVGWNSEIKYPEEFSLPFKGVVLW